MAFRLLFGIGALATAVLACTPNGAGITTSKLVNETLPSGRSYLLFIPKSYITRTTPAPLILSFHGGDRNASQQAQLDLLTTPFFNKEYVVAYPQGIHDRWEGVPGVTTDDTAFVGEILDTLEAQLCLDTSRLFATGKSDGGGFVGNVLACHDVLSRRIAAFAPVSGAFYSPNNTAGGAACDPYTLPHKCDNGRTDIPLIEFHGGNDSVIPYLGRPQRGECLPWIPLWMQQWAGRDELGTANTSYPLTVNATVFQYGAGGAMQGLVTHVFDGITIGHSWPATIWNDDNKHNGDGPASFNASSVILEFFEAWTGGKKKERGADQAHAKEL